MTIHASVVAVHGRGVMLMGASGSGKSSMALRLIQQHKAILISDDYVDLSVAQDRLIAAPPAVLAGKLEVRHVGMITLPYLTEHALHMHVMLKPAGQCVRLPDDQQWMFADIKLPSIHLPGHDIDNDVRIMAALQGCCDA